MLLWRLSRFSRFLLGENIKRILKIALATLAILASTYVGIGQANAEQAILPPTNHVADSQLSLDLIASEGSGAVSWTTVESSQRVTLSRDGIQLDSEIGNGSYVDLGLTSGEEPTYAIRVAGKASGSELVASGFIGSKTELAAALPLAENIDILSAQVGIPYPPSVNIFGVPAQAATTPVNNTTVRYQTFIPDAQLAQITPNPCLTPVDNSLALAGISSFAFAGDNRNFDATPSSSRTKFEVTADWLNSGKLIVRKSVGYSHKLEYRAFIGLYADTILKAPTTGMVATINSQTSTSSSFNLHHDVENPFCPAGAANGIYYDYDFTLTSRGTYVISGLALNAPNHELYLENDYSGTWATIFRRTGNMTCLVPLISGLYCNLSSSNSGIL